MSAARDFRYIFTLHNGDVIHCAHRDAQRVIDKPADQAKPEVCWEIRTPSGLIRRVWDRDLRTVWQEPV